jgi:hypothetical protein
LNKREIEYTRCLIANAIDIPPDNIGISREGEFKDIVESYDISFFYIEDYKTFDLAIAFENVPTLPEVKIIIRELYLCAKEQQEQEEN